VGLRGAKPGYIEWEQDHKLALLSGWARDGYTNEEMAKCIGIDEATFYRWKKESRHIRDAIKTEKIAADYAVEQALYNKALTGDVGAICFWLKNRQPDKWRDKREIDMKATQIYIADSIPDDDDATE
jgi:transcriptional regulator with XRE-family HTH domain